MITPVHACLSELPHDHGPWCRRDRHGPPATTANAEPQIAPSKAMTATKKEANTADRLGRIPVSTRMRSLRVFGTLGANR